MSAYTVTSSAELMQNYIQSGILEPQRKFIALQTSTGASLLFSIGTDDAFNVTKELQAAAHGWTHADLSSAQAKADFPKGATCKTFAAAQAVAGSASAAIHLAMVLDDDANDHLYLSLTNSDVDTGWTDKPAWTPCPFNAKDSAGKAIPMPKPFKIADTFVTEASDKEYIVVDIIRNPTDTDALVSRFYIDTSTPAAPVWMPHDISIDLEAASYKSCLGRASYSFGVDGLYTMGRIAGSPQLIYTPLFNPFDPATPALPARLMLPSKVQPDAMAACRNADNTSDLYVAAQGGLYYFASTNQKDNATGVLLVSHALLSGVRDLYAYTADGKVTVWGLNGSDEVFYLTCDRAQLTNAGAWNTPIAILIDVDAISPYIDRMFSANTFFAHSGDSLLKAIKTPDTGMWSRSSITLPPSELQQPARKISSYTTRLQVNDEDGRPAPNITVSLTATSVTSVYIDHLYYVVGPQPIEVVTDEIGSVTIVELVHTLAGTRFNVTVDAQQLLINPMDAPFQRSAKLNTVSALKSAVITNQDGSTRPFIPHGTSDDDLKAVAQSNDALNTAYQKLAASSSSSPQIKLAIKTLPTIALPHVSKGVLTDVGDLFSALESGIKGVVSIVEDAAEGVWHFVVSIADKVYYGILDAVEKVVAAVMWVYNAIKIIIRDIILFLEFLFLWPDILATHRVMKNVFVQTVHHVVDGLNDAKADVASLFREMQSELDKWADIPNFDQTAAHVGKSNPAPAGLHSAPANLGVHHFKGNYRNSDTSYQPPSPAEAIFEDLIKLVKNEEATMTATFNAVKTDIIDQFAHLSLTEIIKRLLEILGDTVLQTAENVVPTLLDILAQLAKGVLGVLTARIDIPVISTLYHDLTGDDLSFLDLMCLIAAIPATIVYKLGSGEAPFPHGDTFTDRLSNARSFAEVKGAFFVSGGPKAVVAQPATKRFAVAQPSRIALAAADDQPLDVKKLRTFGMVEGVFAGVGSVVLIVTANAKLSDDGTGWGAWPGTIATINAFANVAYVAPNISSMIMWESERWYARMNAVITGVSILKGFIAIPFAALDIKLVKLAIAGAENWLNQCWNVPVIANLVYNASDATTSYKALIPDSIGNFAFNLGGMLEPYIEIMPMDDPKTALIKAAEVRTQQVLMGTYGAMTIVAAGIFEWAPGQKD
ncbi:hypothetical protein Nham_1161 [Nitrobacter hamburgensis X14]|uniref:Uncharacterized protein n=1 Tax=Nitrobacter hamburgensis (strain DSM 10229 / NCIMB 13809 / X14) TaxID=323097 RepID=Q1QP42_NITHX|nr:hypothetical protein [Nitrobacter hamburgensis]ABE62005.1 hypothetical protein Nham_1161 [Nitrobacter hamburgensis X14]